MQFFNPTRWKILLTIVIALGLNFIYPLVLITNFPVGCAGVGLSYSIGALNIPLTEFECYSQVANFGSLYLNLNFSLFLSFIVVLYLVACIIIFFFPKKQQVKNKKKK